LAIVGGREARCVFSLIRIEIYLVCPLSSPPHWPGRFGRGSSPLELRQGLDGHHEPRLANDGRVDGSQLAPCEPRPHLVPTDAITPGDVGNGVAAGEGGIRRHGEALPRAAGGLGDGAGPSPRPADRLAADGTVRRAGQAGRERQPPFGPPTR